VAGTWTPERVEELKTLWPTTMGAREIGLKLGLGQKAKMAVIGKARRLSLPAKDGSDRRSMESIRATHRRNDVSRFYGGHKAVKQPPVENTQKRVECDPERIRLIDLTDTMCHWPIGDPRDDDFHFCGAQKSRAVPYCNHHMAVSRSKTAPKT
jgi:GcrA cell cycle regulator